MTNSNIGWTAQSKDHYIEDAGEPGNVVPEHLLPHPEVQRAAGINPDQYRRQHGLWIEESDQERPAFVGTETGRTPEEVFQENGTMESFQSQPEDYPEEFYISQYHGGSNKGLEYPRDASGHILDSLHNQPAPIVVSGQPVVDEEPVDADETPSE